MGYFLKVQHGLTLFVYLSSRTGPRCLFVSTVKTLNCYSQKPSWVYGWIGKEILSLLCVTFILESFFCNSKL